ncbi:hypothetical protein JXM83_01285 [Candidatus Woesearchaeota archaeon]|nr:hypothetical protein [Candidatus Woesearchaeota archaeon]
MTQILEELHLKFEQVKKELKFNSDFEELDEIFYFKDMILQLNFVSPKLSRMLCSRIRDTFYSWVGSLQDILLPNNTLSYNESQIFTEKEKEIMTKYIDKLMAHITKNTVIGLTKNKEQEGKYIDDSVVLWNEIKPYLIEYSSKKQEYWETQKNNPDK